MKKKLILFGILVLAAAFRFYGLNWDQGYHLHPDERAIIMDVVKLEFPTSIDSFLSKDSPWNTKFFAYGSFPFYLLKIIGQLLSFYDPLFSAYDLINIAGRFTSAAFDMATIIVLFMLARKLFGEAIAYLSVFFYALSVLPIQLSHFYAVDTILTFFSLAVLYNLILFYENPTIKRSILIGIFFGLALATKVSAIVLLASVGISLMADFVLYFLKHPHKPRLWYSHLNKALINIVSYASIISIITFITFSICSPYALIDFQEFWRQTLEQSRMTDDAFTFPYTLQYVNKIPYFYELKNIFLWGLGPLIATLSLIGIFQFFHLIFIKKKTGKWAQEVIIAVFFLIYFWIVGKFAIGFMRYMLPLYPLLCLFASLTGYKLLKFLKHTIKNQYVLNTCYLILYTLIIIWPLSFIHIYTVPNTRTTATRWINEYIEPGKIVAQEHWDDPVPLSGAERYRFATLPLYDPDTPEKWQNIDLILSQTDYIIIASNRLYTPLQKLTNCSALPPGRCYTRTAQYYKDLFNGKLNFQKIAQFEAYPQIPLFKIPIDDQSADESFTVYDHPKIMIYQRINPSL